MRFKDRVDAGIQLAQALREYEGEEVIVFALPRGGVVLGAEIARQLRAPLDLILTKKIGHPLNPEYAIGAVGETGEPIWNPREADRIDPAWFQREVSRIRQEIRQRRADYSRVLQRQDATGKIAILVDDGIATGLTMFAAIQEIKAQGPRQVVVAIPVTPDDTAQALRAMDVELVSLEIDPYYLGSVGAYYRDFRQVEDSEVIELLTSSSIMK